MGQVSEDETQLLCCVETSQNGIKYVLYVIQKTAKYRHKIQARLLSSIQFKDHGEPLWWPVSSANDASYVSPFSSTHSPPVISSAHQLNSGDAKRVLEYSLISRDTQICPRKNLCILRNKWVFQNALGIPVLKASDMNFRTTLCCDYCNKLLFWLCINNKLNSFPSLQCACFEITGKQSRGK